MRRFAALFAIAAGIALAQTAPDQTQPQDATTEPTPERWNLYYQATSIGQYHGPFHSPYEGPFSLQDYPERAVSITTTLFWGLRLADHTQFYFDPEIAGGRGFSGVNGIANETNGELPRVASATPKPYIARLYITQDFGFGDEKEAISSDANQLSGERPMVRYSITIGRFSLTDFFDNNRYSHDPRSQFMGWAVMYNGAWDYPADTRGYTWGWVHELHTRNWSFRYASAAEPKTANGPRFDRRLFVNRGDTLEQERRFTVRDHPGALRVLEYANHANSGNYAEAIQLSRETGKPPNVSDTLHNGTLKYGAGVNFEQEITKDFGVFGRLGWNDGKTESFAFTAIDRLAQGGISLAGTSWKRKEDVAGSVLTVSGLSAVHREYLALGGTDFLLGDGKLNYGTENVWESYYNARLFPGFFISYDLQYIQNPAYNRDRGPVWVNSIRLHLEAAKK